MESTLFLIGRILFGGYFIIMAVNHFTHVEQMAGYTQSKAVPSPRLAVLFTGLLLLIGGIGVLLGIYVNVAIAALVLFFVPVTFTMHAFWKVQDPQAKMMEQVQFMKNLALLAAVLMLLAIPQPWPISL
jgi:putative oxidoreductase